MTQAAFTFTPARQPVGSPEDQVALVRKLHAVKTGARWGKRPPAPRALETQGLDALQGYTTDAKRRPCVVRTVYTSLGGETLVCDSEPMTMMAACERAMGPAARFTWCLWAEIVPVGALSVTDGASVPLSNEARHSMATAYVRERASDWSDLRRAEQDRLVHKALTHVPTHARGVVFPSQRTEPVETVTTERPSIDELIEQLNASTDRINARLAALGH